MGDSPPGDLDSWPDVELVGLAQMRIEGGILIAWEAFKVLWRRYVNEVANTVHVFLLRTYFISDHDLAEQLTQEAFVKAWDALPKKNPQAPFIAWIKRIAINEAWQDRRKHRREIALTNDEEQSTDNSDPLEQSPEEQAALQDAIERTKMRLSEQERAVFTLHHEQGYSEAEIASMLGIRVSSVRQTLWRATRRFREEWLKETSEGDSPPPQQAPKKGKQPSNTVAQPQKAANSSATHKKRGRQRP